MSVQLIKNLGDDALANLWDMNFGQIPFMPDLQSAALRIQNFNIPATGANVYEVHYKTQMFTKPGGKVDAPNEFTFEFRVDRNWIIYKGFVAWKNAVANSYTGNIGADNATSTIRTPVTIWAVGGDGLKLSGVGAWRFDGCFCQNVGDISFDYTTGDPITVTVTMGFLRMNDLSL